MIEGTQTSWDDRVKVKTLAAIGWPVAILAGYTKERENYFLVA